MTGPEAPTPLQETLRWPNLRNALIVALVVGSLLNLINQGDALLQERPVSWLKLVGGWGNDSARGVTVDAHGAIWVGGYFAANTGGGPGPKASFGETTLATKGSLDGFVVKLDDAGEFSSVKITSRAR